MITTFGYRGGINALQKGLITSRYLLNLDSKVNWEAPEPRMLACTTMLEIKGRLQGEDSQDKHLVS